MSDQEKPKTVSVIIDGKPVEVPAGLNLIEAAARIGKEVPHYCYHPKLSVSGNCRMCLVEMGMPMKDRTTGEPVLDENGQQKIGWGPKPVIGCATQVAPGMHVKTDSPVIKSCREGVMEFLLLNHPLDCPICDQAGECHLQEFSTEYGRGYSRFVEDKNVKPKRTRLGPRVMLDDERCILCSRCIRFCQEVPKDPVLGFTERGSHTTLTCFPGRELDNNYSLNTVDICPVGALTSTDFRFKMRVWFLKRTASICTESSVGSNTEVWSREGKIYRITPRRNDEVNDTWMTDSGRMLYKQVEAENRLARPMIDRNPVSVEQALERAAEFLKGGGLVAWVGSAHLTLEEQFLLASLVKAVPGDVHLPSHRGDEDGLLMSCDHTPNLRGALLTGLIKMLPPVHLGALAQAIEKGEVKTLLVCREDLTTLGIPAELLRKLHVIYIGTREDATSKAARVVLPGLTVFEKEGSFVNRQFRLQKFAQAVPGPTEALPESQLLLRLWKLLSPERALPAEAHSEALWELMAREIPQLSGLTFASVPATGLLLDATAFRHLKFPEAKGLHYEPAAPTMATQTP